jgi:hypothetical protein
MLPSSRALVYMENPVSNDSTVEHYMGASPLKYVLTKPTDSLKDAVVTMSRKLNSLKKEYHHDPLGSHLPRIFVEMLEMDASIQPAVEIWQTPTMQVDTSASILAQLGERDVSCEETIQNVRPSLDNIQVRRALTNRALHQYYLALHYCPPRWAFSTEAERDVAHKNQIERAKAQVLESYSILEYLCMGVKNVGEEVLRLYRSEAPMMEELYRERRMMDPDLDAIEWEEE